jgi:heme/copper-type cytochrome/quinol oxidase subunit 1
MWIISGVTMFLVLYIKLSLAFRIYKRSKDPEFYHINFFGKKVYNEKLIKNFEYMIFFITIPFFLLIGAYFVARLINLYFYGHL